MRLFEFQFQVPLLCRPAPVSIPYPFQFQSAVNAKNPSRVASPLVASFHFRFSSLSVSVLTSYPVGQSVSQSFSHSISNFYNERAHHECLYIIIKIIILFVALQRNPTLPLHKWSNLRLSHCLTVCLFDCLLCDNSISAVAFRVVTP